AFRIRTRAELVTSLDEVGIQGREVVRLAIEDDPQGLIFVGDGLIPALDINNRKPPGPQADTGLHVEAIAVGASMADCPGHRLQQALLGRLLVRIGEATDTTHRRYFTFSRRSANCRAVVSQL